MGFIGFPINSPAFKILGEMMRALIIALLLMGCGSESEEQLEINIGSAGSIVTGPDGSFPVDVTNVCVKWQGSECQASTLLICRQDTGRCVFNDPEVQKNFEEWERVQDEAI